MYSLFELRHVLQLNKSDEVLHSSYIESRPDKTVLVLVCGSGYLLFYISTAGTEKPWIHQMRWFSQPSKEVRALCFDPLGSWLLVAVADGSLYIVPVPNTGNSIQNPKTPWRTDDITDIRLSVQRASPTCIKWWNTSEGQHVAIIGNELGEIIFINLKNKKEIGSAYIHAIENEIVENLELTQDEDNGVTSLLITDSSKRQWHLILEDYKSDFYWLSESDSEIHVGVGSIDRKLWQMQGERSLFIEDKRIEGRPCRMSKYEGVAYLFPQVLRSRSVTCAYNSTQGRLQLLPSTLEMPYLSTYDVPENCELVILVEKFIFLVEANDTSSNRFYVVSCHFADVAKKGKDFVDPVIQNFAVNSSVMKLYKRSASYYLAASQIASSRNKCQPDLIRTSKNAANSSNTKTPTERLIPGDISVETSLDGCFIVHKKGVIECRPKIAPEKQFLALTSNPDDLPMAERLGVMLSVNISSLYEVGAELQLAQGHFAQAVRLYQLSKCPQLKRVAHFVSYGFLSELIAYIQVLFSTKSMDIAPADRSHFANIALHCFVQQILNRKNERHMVVQAFRDFLRDNLYYDDEVAIRILSEQGLYELLHFCSNLRGQQRLMLEHLLCSDCQRESVDQSAHDAIKNSGYGSVLTRTQNEYYLRSITSSDLLQHMATKPQLLKCHIQHLAQFLPGMSTELLLRAAKLYDPSHPAAELAVRSVLTFHNQRYFSMSSLSSISSDSLDLAHGDDETMNEEELIKFFIFILLLLNNKRETPKFELKLMQNGNDKRAEAANKRRNINLDVSLGCGLSHSALVKQGSLFTWGKGQFGRLGHGDAHQEFSQPMHVDLLYLKVLSVSCGALHTLALTDYGVFGWGYSKYGQLGMGDLQRTARPLMIEAFSGQEVASLACGQYHSLAVTTNGRVYSWGWGVHGQLGHGNVEDLHYPKEIEFFKGRCVIAAVAGHGHSSVLVEDGDVYTFGCGMFGQLGLGTVVKHSVPQSVRLLEPIVQIASGYFHVLVLSCSNKLYSWGCNPQALRLQAQTTRRARMQGSSQSQEMSGYGISPHLPASAPNAPSQGHLFPSIVQTSNVAAKIKKISCGSHHSALLTSDGEVFTWGRNTDGQLGHGTRKEQKSPMMVLSLNDRRVTHIACGSDFMLACDSTGRLWGWGQNDGGQLGQKPITENRSRPAATHSQGRVITIRTNRRMITFTQSCRQGELRPIEVISIPMVPEITAVDILDSNSIDNDVTLLHQMDYYHKTHSSPIIPYLSSMDKEPYGSLALHAALKAFHKYYDPSSILNHCISFTNWQAAAKLCALEGLYAQALEYQLKAAGTAGGGNGKILELVTNALEIIKFYLKYVDPENFESNKLFLSHTIVFWEEHMLPVESLEKLLSSHLGLLGYPLGLILYCEGLKKEEVLSFQRKLSTDFSIQVSLTVIDHVDTGKPHPDLLEHLVQTSCMTDLLQGSESGLGNWESSLPPHTLWKELLHNFQKGALARSSVHLAPGNVDSLAKALLTEEKQDIVVFTCGHHYTRQNFNTSVLPCFREGLHKLPMSLPQTERLLLSGYQSEGTIPTACPPCVLTEIKS